MEYLAFAARPSWSSTVVQASDAARAAQSTRCPLSQAARQSHHRSFLPIAD